MTRDAEPLARPVRRTDLLHASNPRPRPQGPLGPDALAEELGRLAPFGMGNPQPTLLVPSSLLDEPRAMAEGRHVAFTLAAGGARSRCVCFGRGSSLPAAAGTPIDAAVRLALRAPSTGGFLLSTLNTSITEISLDTPNKWVLRRYGDAAHLAWLPPSSLVS